MGARLFAGLHIHAGHDWFQTGYLTITAEERLGGKVLYRLGYPNREVRQSLNDHLLRHLVQDTAQQTANSIRLARLLEAHDCAGLKTLFHAFFASIPYQWYTNNHIADAQPDAEQVLLASRALSMQVDEDGMVVLRGRLPPEVGALLLRAVEAAMQQVPASAEGGEPTTAQRRADALGLVAESALAGGLDPGNPADRFQVTVQVQADALPAREPAEAGPRVAAETREVSLSPSEPVAQTANLVVEQATIATPHVAAETFEVSEAAGERAALETDLDAGQAVIEQAGGLHLGREAARRVACDAGIVASPATEARLLAVALCATAAQVERLVRAWRRADRDAQPDAEQVLLASRALTMQVDEDGMVVLRGRLPPEVGALLLRAVEAALEQVPASADGGEPTIAQRRADALGLVAESALAGGLDPGNPADRFQVTVHVQADALPARDPADAAPRGSAETRVVSLTPAEPGAQTANLGAEQATIAAPHISAETFEVSEAAFERVAPETDLDAGLAVIEQAGGLHLGREAARRVACDAGIVVLRHAAGGEVLDVGRRTRTVPSAMRRALQSRDRGQCQFPGCDSRHCDAHHVEHWADGGETRLQNLVLGVCRIQAASNPYAGKSQPIGETRTRYSRKFRVNRAKGDVCCPHLTAKRDQSDRLLACRFHHRALHEGGFRVVPGDAEGQFRFLRPDGTPLPAEPPMASWEGAPLAPTDARLAAAGIGIGPHTATPEWYGESLDLTAALDVLWEPPAASWNVLDALGATNPIVGSSTVGQPVPPASRSTSSAGTGQNGPLPSGLFGA